MKPILSTYGRSIRWRTLLPYIHGKVLDVGCGFTFLPDQLGKVDGYVGVDVFPRAIEVCSLRYPQHRFYLHNFEDGAGALAGDGFDTVIMTALFEHLHKPLEFLEHVRETMNPGAHLLLTTPTPLGDLFHQIGSRIKLFYPESLLKHVMIYKEGELKEALEQAGFEVKQYRVFMYGTNQFVVCRLK